MFKTTEGFNLTSTFLNCSISATNKLRELVSEVKLKDYGSDVWKVKLMLSAPPLLEAQADT